MKLVLKIVAGIILVLFAFGRVLAFAGFFTPAQEKALCEYGEEQVGMITGSAACLRNIEVEGGITTFVKSNGEVWGVTILKNSKGELMLPGTVIHPSQMKEMGLKQ
jgi:hypothetical protein